MLSVNLSSGASVSLEGKHAFYFYSSSSGCQIVELSEEKAKEFVYFKPLLKGESVTLYSPRDKDKFLAKCCAKEVFEESVSGVVNRYYYSPKISRFTTVNGEKVNLHISDSNGIITVGIPFIFGSY